MKIISQKFDFCMKELFRKEQVLKYFLSDILGISVEEIKSLWHRNTFLWRCRRAGKLGILDVLVEMNGDTKVSIELQVRIVKRWDKRELFYAGKLLSEEKQESEEDLRMIRTKNPGVIRTIEEVRQMNMKSRLRAEYEARKKTKRVRIAQDAYMREVAQAEGHAQGFS